MLSGIYRENNFKFSKNTTYGLGGYAKTAYFPETEAQAAAVFDYLNQAKEEFTILGNGSNVLAADGFYNGTVISTRRLKGIALHDGYISCQSGTTVSELLNFCIEKEVGGLEYLAGIPASVGGLVLMNGGINSRHIGDDIVSVRFYDGKMREFSSELCKFGNKHSTMRGINCLITGLNLSIFAVPREAEKEKINYYLDLRRNQPKGKSCGCVFKNPYEFSAGELIDKSGLKGLKIGGAEVSRKHANFIINNGATASDVYNLINVVKERVRKQTGITLEEEVIYIGDFNEING